MLNLSRVIYYRSPFEAKDVICREIVGNCMGSEFPSGSIAHIDCARAPVIGDLAAMIDTKSKALQMFIKRISYRTDDRGDTIVYESDAGVPIILRPWIHIVGTVICVYVPARPRLTDEAIAADAETEEFARLARRLSAAPLNH